MSAARDQRQISVPKGETSAWFVKTDHMHTRFSVVQHLLAARKEREYPRASPVQCVSSPWPVDPSHSQHRAYPISCCRRDPTLPTGGWNAESWGCAWQPLVHVLKEDKAVRVKLGTEKDIPSEGHKPSTDGETTESPSKEIFQAQTHSSKAKLGSNDYTQETPFPNSPSPCAGKSTPSSSVLQSHMAEELWLIIQSTPEGRKKSYLWPLYSCLVGPGPGQNRHHSRIVDINNVRHFYNTAIKNMNVSITGPEFDIKWNSKFFKSLVVFL